MSWFSTLDGLVRRALDELAGLFFKLPACPGVPSENTQNRSIDRRKLMALDTRTRTYQASKRRRYLFMFRRFSLLVFRMFDFLGQFRKSRYYYQRFSRTEKQKKKHACTMPSCLPQLPRLKHENYPGIPRAMCSERVT